MNKIWSVVLIVIAVLTVAAGTYWYVEFRPLAGQTDAEQTSLVEQMPQKNPESIQDPSPVFAQNEEPREMAPIPEEPLQSVATPQQETPPPPAIQAEGKQVAYQEVREMPLPVDPLITSGVFKLPRPRGPAVKIPFAPPRAEELDRVQEGLVKQATPDLTVQEEPKKKEDPVEVPLPEPESQKVILTPSKPKVASSEVAFDDTAFQWSINSSVSFLDFQFPDAERGFDLQVDVLRHGKNGFKFGGTLEYGKVGTTSEISVLAKAQWNLQSDKQLSFPLSVSLGPTVFLDPEGNDFGVTGKIQGGLSYAITEWMRFFYEAGVQAQWNISGEDFSIQLEPMRVGFGFSF
ncbi:MAG: hypothetical protein AB7D92_01250 [Sphaerochaeta sp.]